LHTFLLYLAVVILLIVLSGNLWLFLGARMIVRLQDVDAASLPDGPMPKVDVIVAARNEQRHIEEALQSLLNQDYDELQILVVNDRSTDRTGEILDSVAEKNPQLKVIHLTELPAGWLGKNYALYCAAQQATGDWLLFTDADVVMAPSSVRRALGYARANEIDHLSVFPEVKMPTWFLKAFVIAFAVYFNLFIQPWKAKDPKSKAYVGIGAFNLVRAEVYRAVGTHRVIAMRLDDDIKLGKIVKHNGYRQEMLNGTEFIYVPWYSSVGELIDGTMKHFAGLDYSVLAVMAVTTAILVLNVWPFVAVFVTAGSTRLMYIAVVLALLWQSWATAGQLKISRDHIFASVLGVLLYVYILWRAMLLALINNGISWRGTRYPLAELKANKV